MDNLNISNDFLELSSSTTSSTTIPRKKVNEKLDILKEAEKNFNAVLEMFKSKDKNSQIATFFSSMAQQTEKAQLPMDIWLHLQMKVMSNVQEAIREAHKK